ncbi:MULTISPECIES: response regulator transcription factor [Virgibacillus]|uniref:Response regulator transcription factor n=1 Tax=Virgibacillus halodenitrificans TaxID=1482 RepID=A0ABR7VNW0_VIRHA|nr:MULTISPECIES: response regulator transcription factor [Virgibacillus]AIF44886.1 transcriptional regulator [Virgibacillus sp. SK37]MBD1222497.1 response regulator transcription factor [Virgibacillus halodenitrificans]
MKQTIMIVEDDTMIRQLIRMYLEKHDYDVVEATDGEEAQHKFLTYRPCLIILDLMLPKLSGEDFLTWLREKEEQTVSVIMLSAKASITDKIAGLRLGADDYITKPFDPNELIAHVEAVLRRTGQFCQKVVLDGLCIMPRKGEVLLYDQVVNVTKHEFQLLYYFMQNPNIVFSREQLISQLYPNEEQTVMDRTIDAHIKKLREKIETSPAQPKRIQTVRGMGYKFVTNT